MSLEWTTLNPRLASATKRNKKHFQIWYWSLYPAKTFVILKPYVIYVYNEMLCLINLRLKYLILQTHLLWHLVNGFQDTSTLGK